MDQGGRLAVAAGILVVVEQYRVNTRNRVSDLASVSLTGFGISR